MKPEVIDTLGGARDFHSLTKAVLDLCEPYGPVHAFRLIHNRAAPIISRRLAEPPARTTPTCGRTASTFLQ